MFLFLKSHKKSRTPVVLHFIEEVRQGTTRQSYPISFFRKNIRYLYIMIYIFIYIKYLLGVRLFNLLRALGRKNKDNQKRERLVDLSYSYEIFERNLLFIKHITAKDEVRLLSRTPVVLVVPQSLFENTLRRPSCN